ncbi:unnamed protein product [Brassicogethes aeneus]|uniref:Uncharacterized protein n=1 Tax=Brassicogethes aeneus TaxID=1431903 RepID=A0A9P0BFF4_BRAAE|nr:unnamed protein product [Brassicogethes aeneus]
MANYSFRTRKIMANFGTDPYEFEESLNETKPFSSGSSDEVHSSDFSSTSDSSNDINPGYLEVSKEKLCLEGLDPQDRAPVVTDGRISDQSDLDKSCTLNELRNEMMYYENNEPGNAMFNSHNSDSESNLTQLNDLYDTEIANSPIILPQDQVIVTNQTLLDCNYVPSDHNGNLVKGNLNMETPLNNVEQIENKRRWTKKNCCPYCFVEITHFPRHLQRNHPDERAVQDIFCLNSKNPKRKLLLDALRRQGNYLLTSNAKITRPVRRPRSLESDENYSACNYCLGYYKKTNLRKHRKKCPMIKNQASSKTRISHLSETQAFALCSGIYKEFYDSLRLKSEVIDKMRPDNISKAAIKDILICSYGESQLKRHRRVQLAVSVSNKMREMGRILLVLKDSTGIEKLLDALKPEMFDNVVTATRVISGYNHLTHTFTAPSLALHMGTRLIQVCDIASQLIIKKNRFIDISEPEKKLKNIKRFRSLITNHWNTELSSIALKDLNEKNWEKPKLFPLTEDIIKFQRFLTERAQKNYNNIKQKVNIKVEYKNLTECVLALTLLLNRKRIGEVQYLKVKTYCNDVTKPINAEFLASLTPQEQILSENFKRVVTGGKGSKPIAILFPKKTQDLIQLMLEVRADIVHPSNEYLFANLSTKDRWLSGYHVVKKLAEESGTSNKDLFTSTRLRKQIATVLQVSNFSETDMEQFANFMGHTQKTHAEYYRLPQDVYQTAKVSKILMAINKGDSSQFKGKSLNDIKVSENDLVDSDSDSDNESLGNINSRKTFIKKRINTLTKDINTSETSMTDNEEMNIPGPSRAKCEDELTKKTLTRVRWSEDQKSLILKHFENHIKSQNPPKKKKLRISNNNLKNCLKIATGLS